MQCLIGGQHDHNASHCLPNLPMPTTHPARLQIATTGLGPGPSRQRDTLSPYDRQPGRLRSASTASDASTLSIVSPMPSSSSSSSSLTRQQDIQSPKTSLDLDETLGPMTDYVLAMHDYNPQHQNATCLSFKAGQVIHVLNRDNSGWWDGELEGRRGWFPSNYVNIHPEEEEDVTEILTVRRSPPNLPFLIPSYCFI